MTWEYYQDILLRFQTRKITRQMKREKLSIDFFFDKLHTKDPPTMSQLLRYSSLRRVHLELNWSLKRKNWHPSWFWHASWHVTASAWVPFLIILDLSRVQLPKVMSLQGSSINPLKSLCITLKNVFGIIFIISINYKVHSCTIIWNIFTYRIVFIWLTKTSHNMQMITRSNAIGKLI